VCKDYFQESLQVERQKTQTTQHTYQDKEKDFQDQTEIETKHRQR